MLEDHADQVRLRKAFEFEPAGDCMHQQSRRPGARPKKSWTSSDLFIQLTRRVLSDSLIIFTSARDGGLPSSSRKEEDMSVLRRCPFSCAGAGRRGRSLFQLLISTTDYNEYVGRIGIGKIERGTIRLHDDAVIVNYNDPERFLKTRIVNIYEFEGLKREAADSSRVGSIVAVTGVEGITIGDTLCASETPEAVPFVKISEPTLAMNFSVNDSPFAGLDGKYVTSRHLRARLYRELRRTSVPRRGYGQYGRIRRQRKRRVAPFRPDREHEKRILRVSGVEAGGADASNGKRKTLRTYGTGHHRCRTGFCRNRHRKVGTTEGRTGQMHPSRRLYRLVATFARG